MRNHNHSFFRFFIDVLQIIILFLIFLAPIFLVTSLKVKDLNLKAEVVKAVAGAKNSR
jgi:hypothetical protein